MGYTTKAEVKTWLEEAKKRKLQVENSTDNCKGLRRIRRNRKRPWSFLKGIRRIRNSFFTYIPVFAISVEPGVLSS